MKNKIAIIDNNKKILKVIEQQLKKIYDCYVFTEFKNNIINNNFDLIILDMKLEKVNGLDIAKIIKKQKENQKIILITGYSDMFEFNSNKHKNYFNKMLLKPIQKSILLATIQEVLNGMD